MPRHIPYDENHRTLDDGTIEKKCNRCDNWLPCTSEYFYKTNTKTQDNLFPYCKKCNIKNSTQWQKDNPEKWLAHNNKMNKKPCKIEQRRDNEKKRRRNGYYKDLYKNNPEQFKQYNQKHQQHKKHTVTNKQWESCKEYFYYQCAYCGLPIDKHWVKYKDIIKLRDFHKEHIDDDGANDLSNCIPSCKSCNSHKWKHDVMEWYPKQEFYSKERLDKIYQWLNQDYKNCL